MKLEIYYLPEEKRKAEIIINFTKALCTGSRCDIFILEEQQHGQHMANS